MRSVLLIAWREFAENAKTKGFWMGIFMFPAILILSSQIPILLERKATPSRHFVLVDQTGEFESAIMEAVNGSENERVLAALRTYVTANQDSNQKLPPEKDWTQARPGQPFDAERALTLVRPALRADAPPFVAPRAKFIRVALPSGVVATQPMADLERDLRPYVSDQKKYTPPEVASPVGLFASVVIPPGFGVGPGNGAVSSVAVRFWSVNQADTELKDRIERAVSSELRLRAFRTNGFDSAVIARIEAIHAPFEQFNPLKAAGEEKAGLSDTLRQWAPSAFVYLLWVAIFSIAQMLLNSLIEEKSNRIIEVLLSSVTPGELMIGKLLGVAMVGLVMLGAWIATMVGIVAYMAFSISHGAGLASAGPAAQIPHDLFTLLSSTWLLPGFAVYFLLGYVLYASLIMALGSTCNTLKDAQNYMAVIVLFLMVPLLAMPFIPRDPNGAFATFMSWIPPYTPFIMMNRITAHPPVFDVVGTMLLLLGFDVAVLWGCGRIFRVGVLRTGQPPRFLQVLAWIRSK